MTPAARIEAAIGILDAVRVGQPAEQVLTGWARRNRYAGSKDRAAVRDHVFDALRRRRSLAALGGAQTGRGLMLGLCRATGSDPQAVFSGAPYAPAALTPGELAGGHDPVCDAERLDVPDWLWPRFAASLGADAEAAAIALQQRAPVHLRVNLTKTDRAAAVAVLTSEGVVCRSHPAATTALEVVSGGRRVRQGTAYRSGLVELQDAASQAVVEALPLGDGMRVLDYCAGGGGKALAMAARADITLFAHDAASRRMRDLPERAARAGIRVTCLATGELATRAPFDLVLCDAPCSGSGAWRRAPEGKWRLTPDRLLELVELQAEILTKASGLVGQGGVLAYATCSLLAEENRMQVDRFLAARDGWANPFARGWSVQDGTDGFFLALLTRNGASR